VTARAPYWLASDPSVAGDYPISIMREHGMPPFVPVRFGWQNERGYSGVVDAVIFPAGYLCDHEDGGLQGIVSPYLPPAIVYAERAADWYAARAGEGL
jgi:hypothetical protein